MAKKAGKTEIVKSSIDILTEMNADVNKHYGRKVMIWGKHKESVEKLPFNIFPLDIETGGFPRGRWVGLVGDPGTFKSSTLYSMMGSAQRVCGTCMRGVISEINLEKVKVPSIENWKPESGSVLKIGKDGEPVSKLFLMDGNKLNVYCPGEEVTHKKDLVLYKYKLECSECRSPQYSVVVLIDAEHNYTKSWARKFGAIHYYISLASVTYSQMIGDIGRHGLKTGRVSMLAVDSVDAQGPKEEDEESLEDWQMGLQARIWNKIVRIYTSYLNKSFIYKYVNKKGKQINEERWPEPTISIIMQYREKIGGYGDPRVAGGGRGKEYAFSLNIEFMEGEKDWVMTGGATSKKDHVSGLWFNFFLKKSKVGTPYKRGRFYYNVINMKVENERSIIDYGLKFNIIKQGGAWFTLGQDRFQGKPNLANYLQKYPKEFQKLKRTILAKIKK